MSRKRKKNQKSSAPHGLMTQLRYLLKDAPNISAKQMTITKKFGQDNPPRMTPKKGKVRYHDR